MARKKKEIEKVTYKELDAQMIRFAEHYIRTGNALESARVAEYDNVPSAAKHLLEENSPVWQYIEQFAESMQHTGIMGARECMKLTSNIARGKTTTKVPMVVAVGDGCSEVEMVSVPPSISEQLNALKLISKWYGLEKGFDSNNATSGVIIQFGGESRLED